MRVLCVAVCVLLSGGEVLARKRAVSSVGDITQSSKYASLVVNATTGEVLHRHNAEAKLHPASLTKMMTLYLVFQSIKSHKLSFNTSLPVSKFAASQPPLKLWLKPGQKVSLRDAVYGVILHSANDAAVVVAEAIAGSEQAFAVKMTQVARQLGMKDTVFRNASGLHNQEQVTTAVDMAKLGIALRRDFPDFYDLFSKRSFIFKGAVINGHNMVLKRYRGADGLKTGYVAASGFNLVTSANRPEGRIVGVVMGGPSIAARDSHMMALLDKGYTQLAMNSGSAKHEVAGVQTEESTDHFSEVEAEGSGQHHSVFAAAEMDGDVAEDWRQQPLATLADKELAITSIKDAALTSVVAVKPAVVQQKRHSKLAKSHINKKSNLRSGGGVKVALNKGSNKLGHKGKNRKRA